MKKKLRTPAEKAAQKERTRRNKRIKYERLLKEYPDSKDAPIWQKKLAGAKQ